MRSSKNNFLLSLSLPVRRWSNLRRQNFRFSTLALPLFLSLSFFLSLFLSPPLFPSLVFLLSHPARCALHVIIITSFWSRVVCASLRRRKGRERRKEREEGEEDQLQKMDRRKRRKRGEKIGRKQQHLMSAGLDMCVSVFRTKDAKCVTSCGEEKEEE